MINLNKAFVGIFVVMLLSGCARKYDNYMLVFKEKKGVEVTEKSQNPFSETNSGMVELDYVMPMAYRLKRKDYVMTIKHNYDSYHSLPDFQIYVKSGIGNYLYLKIENDINNCFSLDNRGIPLILQDPTKGFRFFWYGGAGTSLKDERNCDEVTKKGLDIPIRFAIYNKKMELVGKEELHAVMVLNGKLTVDEVPF